MSHSSPIRLLIFGHVPPPHHGQSYMIQLMLDGFRPCPGASNEVACWHVDARYSLGIEDIGGFRLNKALLVLKYCFQALRLRFSHQITHFYYVPAPGMPMPVFRDWIVMLLCRPFFKKTIFHWHSVGLGEWLEIQAPAYCRRISKALLGGVALSIVLSRYNASDAAKFNPKKIAIVANGIPDPCPHFDAEMLPERRRRRAIRSRLKQRHDPSAKSAHAPPEACATFQVLFVALCYQDKGLFETVDGVLAANRVLCREDSPFRLTLAIAGKFYTAEDEDALSKRLALPEARGVIAYKGFVAGVQKRVLFEEADVFCFPTYYPMEGQPVNLIEAMAFGLPIVATKWRSIPEMVPEDYPGLVDIKSHEQIASALIRLIESDLSETMRRRFLSRYSLEHYIESLKSAIMDA